ncbi:hypothetical protein [Ruegeria sp. A3M17]|uniref:hypothetical protein n=1 Tax=Ruegeria sp. A3M17 TaxID=2267229 RepID=UPI0011BEC2E7|nr:hypothetical protein [Ruegeria sp. A3M17]
MKDMFFKSILDHIFKSAEQANSVPQKLAGKTQIANSGAVNKKELTVLFGDVLNEKQVRSGENQQPVGQSQK